MRCQRESSAISKLKDRDELLDWDGGTALAQAGNTQAGCRSVHLNEILVRRKPNVLCVPIIFCHRLQRSVNNPGAARLLWCLAYWRSTFIVQAWWLRSNSRSLDRVW